ncbi:YcjF family protein [Aestuariibacter halophilus]|uniref:YcjF family protein n=1 Tax=Fluctibacter halophilus TaxID=226011 RepID=A0ABS8GA33_9ALTE|nr:TIGR01620 family protein [Aestuariibacter halophilus]MCC2616665.1 YcjF family protein [Aestuariibacter halophilus]
MTDKSAPLRPAKEFSSEQQTLTAPVQEVSPLKPASEVDNCDIIAPEALDSVESEPLPSPRRAKWWWRLGLAVVGLSAVEVVLAGLAAWQSADWLAGLWLVVLVAVLWLSGQQLVQEWRGLRALRRQSREQELARTLLRSPSIGVAQPFCEGIAQRMPSGLEKDVVAWQQHLKPHHSDGEVIALFERQVLGRADEQARKIILQQASASAALIAVSPYATLDMAIVLWRNLRMLRQIAAAYGVELSYWGRIALVRQVLKHMVIAGAGEIVSDAATLALGSSVTAKLSGRVAQGMSAGLLTARIGVRGMSVCRPLPFDALPSPKLSDVARTVLKTLTSKGL